VNQRRKGQQVGSRIKAAAAAHEARDVLTLVEVAEELNIARETLRQVRATDLYKGWLEIARRRVAAGVAHDRIVNELVETLAPQLEMRIPTPAEGWESMRSTAAFLARLCGSWNAVHGGEHLLEDDPDSLLVRAAALVGETNLAPGCAKQGQIIKAMLDACVVVPAHGRDALSEMTTFIPWKETT
jgi:hypothetical protein